VPPLTQRGLARLLATGALAFGVLGLARPGCADPRLAIGHRVLFDVLGAFLFGRGSAFAALGAYALTQK
jgi:hypothetical protein